MQYYLSTIITKMLAQGHRFLGLPAHETKMCGTPTKLQEFIATVAAGKALVEPKRRFCFALDNVLVTDPQVSAALRAQPQGASLRGKAASVWPRVQVATETHPPAPAVGPSRSSRFLYVGGAPRVLATSLHMPIFTAIGLPAPKLRDP